jgi:hypothetical protein
MLEESIVNLLLRHNCVVVPAFGGFVAQSTGAIIDMNSGMITPPRKSVLFNKQLVSNDGLLIAHISSENNIEYSAAELFLKSKVADWHIQLKEGKRVSIDKIGYLYLDAERNISFEQDRFFNLLLQSYGLNKVHFIAEEDVKLTQTIIASEKEETKIIPVPFILEKEIETQTESETKIIAIASEEGNRKMWKYLAAAALLPFAFYTYWIPVQTSVLESGMISFKDFNPTYQAGEGIYQEKQFSIDFAPAASSEEKSLKEQMAEVPESEKSFTYKYDADLEFVVRNSDVVAALPVLKAEVEKSKPKVEKEIVELPKKETPKPIVAAKRMNYITGCFSDRANAEAMVKTMKERGLNAYILDENKGMTRVSAGGANEQADFDKIVNKAQAIGYKGWKLN